MTREKINCQGTDKQRKTHPIIDVWAHVNFVIFFFQELSLGTKCARAEVRGMRMLRPTYPAMCSVSHAAAVAAAMAQWLISLIQGRLKLFAQGPLSDQGEEVTFFSGTLQCQCLFLAEWLSTECFQPQRTCPLSRAISLLCSRANGNTWSIQSSQRDWSALRVVLLK